jgi:hypothetical protein
MMHRAIILVLIFSAMLLSACQGGVDTESAIGTGIAQTQQISQLQTQAAGNSSGPNDSEQAGQDNDSSDSATESEQASATPSLTSTQTHTPTPAIPTITLSQDTNCRTGPAIFYGYVTVASAGVALEVVGVPSAANITEYVIVKNPNGSGNCWMWLRYADKTDFSAYNLQSFNTPPTPTPTFTPTPGFEWQSTWTIYVGSPGSYETYSVAMNVAGNALSGAFPYGGGDLVAFTGTISADMQSASGTYTDTSGPDGTFQWQINAGNLDQFKGSASAGGTDFEWCGAKNGAAQPSPCIWP